MGPRRNAPFHMCVEQSTVSSNAADRSPGAIFNFIQTIKLCPLKLKPIAFRKIGKPVDVGRHRDSCPVLKDTAQLIHAFLRITKTFPDNLCTSLFWLFWWKQFPELIYKCWWAVHSIWQTADDQKKYRCLCRKSSARKYQYHALETGRMLTPVSQCAYWRWI